LHASCVENEERASLPRSRSCLRIEPVIEGTPPSSRRARRGPPSSPRSPPRAINSNQDGASMSLTAIQRDDLIRRYEEGPSHLKAALSKVPPEAMKWRPGEGKWSVHEVVCHLADSESNAALRIRYLAAEERPLIVGYDQERWASVFDYHSAPLEPALAVVDSVRANTASLLKRLPEAAWSASGEHTERGRYTAEDWLEMYAEHMEKHSGQIERNVAAWKTAERERG
jgi:DinB superfamily